MSKRVWIVSFMVTLLLTAVPSLVAAEVLTPGSLQYGRSYSEWIAAWNQWALSIPVANHPLFDHPQTTAATPETGVAQFGPVWFLGGKFCEAGTACPGSATRYMRIPRDTALFFPVLDFEASLLEYPNTPGLINGLRQMIGQAVGNVSGLSVKVDGTEILDHNTLSQNFRIQSPAFSFILPSDNIFKGVYAKKKTGTFPAGTYFPGVDDGYFVMLKLDPGTHVVRFTGTYNDFAFSLDVTYNITVQ